MSGGSLNYAFRHVEEAADTLDAMDRPLYHAFAAHLRKVAGALHDTEWVLSGDYRGGAEDEGIRAVVTPHDEVAAAIRIAELAQAKLSDALASVKLALVKESAS